MKIIVLDLVNISIRKDLDFSKLNQLGEIKIFNELITTKEILANIGDAKIIITNRGAFDADLLAKLPSTVKLIAKFSTGVDSIDLKAAANCGIKVCNVPSYSTNSVAQLVLTFILNFATQLQQQNKLAKLNSGWKIGENSLIMSELFGKVLGIFGMGEIGIKVAQIAQAFGMQIVAYSRTPKPMPDVKYVTLDEMAKSADFVTIHSALTPETKGIINKQFLDLMKPTAYLINTSRGKLINEADLIESLQNKRIAGAGLDVLAKEPPEIDNQLLSMDNVIITPHIAWATLEARQRGLDILINNIINFEKGISSNIVN